MAAAAWAQLSEAAAASGQTSPIWALPAGSALSRTLRPAPGAARRPRRPGRSVACCWRWAGTGGWPRAGPWLPLSHGNPVVTAAHLAENLLSPMECWHASGPWLGLDRGVTLLRRRSRPSGDCCPPGPPSPRITDPRHKRRAGTPRALRTSYCPRASRGPARAARASPPRCSSGCRMRAGACRGCCRPPSRPLVH